MFERNETVRVVGEPKGSINEFARVVHVYSENKVWISNLNSRFAGSISEIVTTERIAKV